MTSPCRTLNGIVSLLAAMIVAVIAVPASSQGTGLPLSWSYQQTEREIQVSIAAAEPISMAVLVVTNETTGERWEFRQGALRPDRPWRVVVPGPTLPSNYALSLEGTYRAATESVSIRFRAEPLTGFNFDLVGYQLEGATHGIRIRPDTAVERISVRLVEEGSSGPRDVNHRVPVNQQRPGEVLAIDWDARGKVITMEVTAFTASGNSRTWHYVPWELSGELRELNFETGSSSINPTDIPRLRDALVELREAVEIVGPYAAPELYVAGYTDTVGNAASNERLSRDRARAIARYFYENGLRVPIYYQGFGESVLAVETEDNVANAANRRAVFVMRVGAPPVTREFPRNRWSRL